MPLKITVPDLDDLIRRYEGGASMKQLAEATGLDRSTIQRRLVDAGVHIRGRSEAETLKWAAVKADPEAVKRQCSSAWDACRGRTRSPEERVRGAQTRQARGLHVHRYETEIIAAVERLGVVTSGQHALGVRNLDIAIETARVAVEVVGSRWRAPNYTPAKVDQRTEEVVGAGWSVLYVFAWYRESAYERMGHAHAVQVRPFFDPDAVAKQIVAFAKAMGGDETRRGQYGVIGGYGQPLPAPRGYLHDFARVSGF